jgi:shikimate kinase
MTIIFVIMNITLIGMSGVGKSRIGKLLSNKLNYGFIDIDRIIENGHSKKLQDILDCLGDEKFLKLEEDAILGIGKISNSVISPGGSSIYSERAMNFLKSISKIVFLNASLEEIKRRTVDFSGRGIVGLKEKGLEKLFEERLPLYKRYAGVTIDLKGFNDEVIVHMIIENVL